MSQKVSGAVTAFGCNGAREAGGRGMGGGGVVREKRKKKRYVEVEASVWTEIGGSVHVGGVDRFNSVRPGQVVG